MFFKTKIRNYILVVLKLMGLEHLASLTSVFTTVFYYSHAANKSTG